MANISASNNLVAIDFYALKTLPINKYFYTIFQEESRADLALENVFDPRKFQYNLKSIHNIFDYTIYYFEITYDGKLVCEYHDLIDIYAYINEGQMV